MIPVLFKVSFQKVFFVVRKQSISGKVPFNNQMFSICMEVMFLKAGILEGQGF